MAENEALKEANRELLELITSMKNKIRNKFEWGEIDFTTWANNAEAVISEHSGK